jgi:hypothetical protein
MEPLDAGPSLYFRPVGNRLIGLSGVYVDEMLHCGTAEFLPNLKTTSRIFDAIPETMRTANFAGVNLRQAESGIETYMSDYLAKPYFSVGAIVENFRVFPC